MKSRSSFWKTKRICIFYGIF
ncbi:TPA: hypothetical protein JD313_002768 [Citrobacter amalonaticus]|nr:hypothetical protein [Citrobacter amalonaticus]QMK80586.1 hypothetical protein HVX64_07895 [Citrobacter sp. RHB20-C16]QMK85200.1 hypothetical protein HVX63_07910 [Citrobacter sp. RHB20-C15]MBJ8735154.1 hypothetical protein [Citrobacter amalonaticus]MBJ9073585.1 hypothetical protein [Citrobacter amalonaticus]